MRTLPTALALALAGCGTGGAPPDDGVSSDSSAAAAARPAGARDSFWEMVTVASGVYATVVAEGVNPSRFSTSLIVVRSDHVLAVDSRQHGPAADELLDLLAGVTDLPVRYLVNTHWHGDHVQGNEAFRVRHPEVQIIGGATTAGDIRTLGRERLDEEIARVDGRVAAARGRLESGERDDGTPLTDEERAGLSAQIDDAEAYVDARRHLELVAPDIAVDSVLSLTDAEPRVDILRVGPAHTRGDVVVHLPELGIAAIGDLVEDGFPWFGDGFPSGWARALDRIDALGADILLPGHGPVLRDGEMFETQRRFVHALTDEARRAVEEGVDLESAREQADFSRFETHFTRRLADAPPDERRERFAAFIDDAFARAYAEAAGEPGATP